MIKELEGEISKLESRRDELQAELKEIEAKVPQLNAAMGSALLEGREDSKGAEDLAKLQGRAGMLSQAISQANDKLDDLQKALAIDKQASAIAQARELDEQGLVYLVKIYEGYRDLEEASQAFRGVLAQVRGLLEGIPFKQRPQDFRILDSELLRWVGNDAQRFNAAPSFEAKFPDLAKRAKAVIG